MISGDLNRVYLYLNLGEDEINNILYYAYDQPKKRDFDYLVSTKCGTTSRLISYLLGMKYNGKYKKISNTSITTSNFSSFLTDVCVIEISSTNFELPSHVITFFNDKIYHSYAMKYTLREEEMKKEYLEKILNDFLKDPNKKNWKNITGIDDFENGSYEDGCYEDGCYEDGCYDVIVYEYVCSKVDIVERAKFLIMESLKALEGKRDKRHLYDDFLLILPQNPKKFLMNLNYKLIQL